jgi:hypothetical protein
MTKGKTETKPKTPNSAGSEPTAHEACPPAATLGEAQRLAALILECLAGVRAPPSAAEVLGISLPRYYQLEARALQGLVAALAPRPKGKQPSLENRVKTLEKELETALRAAARQEALVRVTQRSLGLAALTKSPPAAASATTGKRRKPRRPTARALKAAKSLQRKAAAESAIPEVSGDGNQVAGPVQLAVPSDRSQEGSA